MKPFPQQSTEWNALEMEGIGMFREMTKSYFTGIQTDIANDWIQRAASARDPYLAFCALYSAFNSLVWATTKGSSDSKMFEEFREKFPSKLKKEFEYEYLKLSRDSKEFNELCKRRFGLIRNLSTLSDRCPEGREAVFTIERKPIRELDLKKLKSSDQIALSIQLIYQFRCNLVHGTKSMGRDSNLNVVEVAIPLIASLNSLTLRLLAADTKSRAS